MRVFLSYKSEDANLVRGVADRLLAGGLDIWFNEYDISLERYEDFAAEIDAGIRQATHAIVFTNRRWTASDWCRYEMRGLLARLPRPEHLVEVCIPKEEEPRREFVVLAEGDPIVFRGDFEDPANDDLDTLALLVRERLGLSAPLRDRRTEAAPTGPIRLPRLGATLDAGPFRPSLARTDEHGESLGMGLALVADLDGREAFLDLHVWPLRSVLDSLSIPQDQASDDRAVYTAYRRYAHEWLHACCSTSLRCTGSWPASGSAWRARPAPARKPRPPAGKPGPNESYPPGSLRGEVRGWTKARILA
jgi:hypothetical protein